MGKSNINWYMDKIAPNRVRGAIRCYLLKRREKCTLNWTIGIIRQSIEWGVPKQQLHEILTDNEFDKYRNSDRYLDLIERCKEKDLL